MVRGVHDPFTRLKEHVIYLPAPRQVVYLPERLNKIIWNICLEVTGLWASYVNKKSMLPMSAPKTCDPSVYNVTREHETAVFKEHKYVLHMSTRLKEHVICLHQEHVIHLYVKLQETWSIFLQGYMSAELICLQSNKSTWSLCSLHG